MSEQQAEHSKALARRLANAAFNAGYEDRGDAWTRQEKTAKKMDELLTELLNAIDAIAKASA